MSSIRIDIKGAQKVGLRFEQFPDDLRANLLSEIDDMSQQLFGMVQAVTPEATGRLRSQEGVKVFDDKDKISGKVYVLAENAQDAIKAADLEYGSTGKSVDVKQHEMSLDHIFDKMLANPMMVTVPTYARTPNVAAHRFERGPLETMQPEIITRLNAVVAASTEAASK